MLPLYEAKMIHLYDTRWATYEPDGSTRLLSEDEKADRVAPLPRYWVAESEIDAKLSNRWDKAWLLGWRDVCRATDARTLIATCAPRVGFGDKFLIAFPGRGKFQHLQAAWSSFICDFVARQKVGGTAMKYFTMMQVAVPAPNMSLEGFDPNWVSSRVDRLNGWIPKREERARVRAELDAYYFHLYGLSRDDVDYVMETFPIVKRKDQAEFGCYRTKESILAAYDQLTESVAGTRGARDE